MKFDLGEKITYKKLAIFFVGIFILFLLPVIYCSFFDYASGDDLCEGWAAYQVLIRGGSVKEFFRAIYDWAKIDYYGWEGNWSSIILWCLEPSIWGEKVYCITPWIALFSLCGGSIYFLFYYLKKYLSADDVFIWIAAVVLCFFSVQYMPYIRGGIFWYTGMINYIFPYGLCLASFVWIDRYIHTGKKYYLIFTMLFYAYLGGTGYIPILFAFEVLVLLILFNLFRQDAEGRRRIFWLLLPLGLLTAGFIVSAVSPGNAVRGGESYYFDVMRVFTTIGSSIKEGIKGWIHNFITIRPMVLIIPLLFIVAWEQINTEEAELKFRHPLMVLGVLFLLSCSVYAPGIYAQSEVSGGVPDTIYFVFLLAYMFAVIYLTCWFKKLYAARGWKFLKPDRIKKIRVMIVLGEILFCLIFAKPVFKNTTSYVCADFIRSGQLRDFEYQMQERLEILHDPEIKNVVLPEMNSEQGPFMHMALLADPEAYTNMVTARFYGKESVVAIPRTEWEAMYGKEKKQRD